MRTADPVRLQRIIDAAACLFAERHYHEVRIEDIAARAEVSKGAVYRHFKDKDDLYLELILRGMNKLHDAVQERIAEAEEPEEKLRSFVEQVVRFNVSHPFLFVLFQRAEHYLSERQLESLGASRTRFRELLTGVIRDMASSGRWKVDSPEFAARALFGMIRECLRWQTPPSPTLSQRIVQLFLHGLRR